MSTEASISTDSEKALFNFIEASWQWPIDSAPNYAQGAMASYRWLANG